jgi:aminoglycoside phosphotransferase (APT) family kinase protein
MTGPNSEGLSFAPLLPRLARQWNCSDAELLGAQRLSAGASRLSWRLDLRCGPDVRRVVVQRERAPELGRGEVLAEADLLRAAAKAGVPVPEVVAVDPDGTEIGGAYLATSWIEGETIARRILRNPELAAAREAFAGQCGRILARIHAIPMEALRLPDLDPLAAIERMLDDSGQARPAFELALRWLRDHRPPARPPVVVHGDFRTGNFIVGPDGVRAVLDWELAHLGNPVEDIGWLCARAWRFDGPGEVGGMGDVPTLLAAYAAAGGGQVDRRELFWWQVLATARWGAICLEQAREHLSGQTHSVELAVLGRIAAEMEYDVLRMIDRAR